MADTRLSNCFTYNEFFWKLFGLWPGRSSSKYYKYCSVFYLFLNLIIYNFALTLSLIYTPRNIELMIREVIFYFTEVAVTSKVLMVLFKRKQILEAFESLDSDLFKGENDVTKKIIKDGTRHYVFAFWVFLIFSNAAYSLHIIVPVILFWIKGKHLDLPICKYYFLTDEIRDNYFVFWSLYQSYGMYCHMMYNVAIDSFMSGLIYTFVTQLKVINHKMKYLKVDSLEKKENYEAQEKVMMIKLIKILNHYDVLLQYYQIIQNIINFPMFVQFGMSTAIICVVLCGLTLNSSLETTIFLLFYLSAMTSEIFLPDWLGTELSYESQDLVIAAYKSDWIPRSEKFKRSLRLFVERANTPLTLKACKMFPLSLSTFTSIIKLAYSLFALIRNVQIREL